MPFALAISASFDCAGLVPTIIKNNRPTDDAVIPAIISFRLMLFITSSPSFSPELLWRHQQLDLIAIRVLNEGVIEALSRLARRPHESTAVGFYRLDRFIEIRHAQDE